jgi:predicted ATPase
MRVVDAKHYLIQANILWDRVADRDQYPYSLKSIRSADGLKFHPKVTFLVGENGSGKSTLIEALAVAWGFNAEGGSKNFNFSTHGAHSKLHEVVRLIRGLKRARDGFFLRAESYFNVATQIHKLDQAGGLGPPIIDSYGGISLHDQSHGESFRALMEHRFHGRGLYILDEPEAALSPTSQMWMLSRMHELIREDSQFIIATHSPIILSYPDAWIYQIGDKGLDRVAYEDTDHYQVTRDFLNRYPQMLEILLEEE